MPAGSKFHEVLDITIICKCVAKLLLNVNHSKAAGPVVQKQITQRAYKTLHRKQKIDQHEPHYKLGVTSASSEEETVSAPHVALTPLLCKLGMNSFS